MMDQKRRKHLENIRSEDRELQNQAFTCILEETEKRVDWAYDAWDELVEGLRHKDNHVRAISALMAVTKDEKFVTARRTLQSIWKVGIETKMQKTVVEALAKWFNDCTTHKNWTLIRYDIVQDLRNLYDEVKAEKIKQKALGLIESEEDLKYKKKYASVWR